MTILTFSRQQLVKIDEEIRSLPQDDHKARFELSTSADSIRETLRSGNADALATARASWDERAANKGSHEQDVQALEGRAQFMAGDGGGGT